MEVSEEEMRQMITKGLEKAKKLMNGYAVLALLLAILSILPGPGLTMTFLVFFSGLISGKAISAYLALSHWEVELARMEAADAAKR